MITQDFRTKPNGFAYSSTQWQQGLTASFEAMRVPASKIIVLGNIPELADPLPQCLVQHSHDVQACSSPPNPFVSRYNRAEMAAASDAGARYIDVTPWFCSATCTAVVSQYQVFFDRYHVGHSIPCSSAGYSIRHSTCPPIRDRHRAAGHHQPVGASHGEPGGRVGCLVRSCIGSIGNRMPRRPRAPSHRPSAMAHNRINRPSGSRSIARAISFDTLRRYRPTRRLTYMCTYNMFRAS